MPYAILLVLRYKEVPVARHPSGTERAESEEQALTVLRLLTVSNLLPHTCVLTVAFCRADRRSGVRPLAIIVLHRRAVRGMQIGMHAVQCTRQGINPCRQP
jgi:hypothetical protein